MHRVIADHSILVHVYGQDQKLKPYMLCASLDVVPADEKLWTHPPFDGYADDVYVWGRGTLHNKHNVMVRESRSPESFSYHSKSYHITPSRIAGHPRSAETPDRAQRAPSEGVFHRTWS